MIKDFSQLIDKIISDFPECSSIYLGGSYAVGAQNLHSDIDLYLFFPKLEAKTRDQLKLYRETIGEQFNYAFDFTPCHLDFLTTSVPMFHYAYSVKRVLWHSGQHLFGEDLSKYILKNDHPFQNIVQGSFMYLRALILSLKNKNLKEGFNYHYIKNYIKTHIAIAIIQNTQLHPDAFHLLYQGLNNPRYFAWKDFVPSEVNGLHEAFYKDEEFLVNKKSIFIHEKLLLSSFKTLNEYIPQYINIINEKLSIFAKEEKPLHCTETVQKTYNLDPQYLAAEGIFDIQAFKDRVKVFVQESVPSNLKP